MGIKIKSKALGVYDDGARVAIDALKGDPGESWTPTPEDLEAIAENAAGKVQPSVTQLTRELAEKQDKISDLDDIRNGANKGATALQEHQSLDGYATETYVNEKVSSLVNSAPETLDTLKELSDALGGDANFAANVANQIGRKQDKIEDLESIRSKANSALQEHQDISGKLDKSALLDAGIKSINWSTVLDGTFTTVDDPLHSQRPSGTALRHWVESNSWHGGRLIWEKTYKVTFDGTVYDNLVCRYGVIQEVPYDGDGAMNPIEGANEEYAVSTTYGMLGNRNLYDSRYYDTKEPFCIVYIEHFIGTTCPYYFSPNVGNIIILTRESGTHTVKCEMANIQLKGFPSSLKENYGALDDVYERCADGSSYRATSLGQGNLVYRGNFAIGHNNIARNGVDISSTGAIGYQNTVIKGIAIGTRNESTDRGYSFGDSNKTTGYGTVAVGKNNTSSGASSVAVGQWNDAKGSNAHAYGFGNIVNGSGSIASGVSNIANGNMTHVIGMNNIDDGNTEQNPVSFTVSESTIETTRGKYAYIVGNGTSDENRSNAHTLDWNGNAWYAGDVSATKNGTVHKLSEKANKGDIPTEESIKDVIKKVAVDDIILPDGLTRVSYLESDGNQYIDTDFIPRVFDKHYSAFDSIDKNKSLSYEIKVDFMRTRESPKLFCTLIGCGTFVNADTFDILFVNGMNNVLYSICSEGFGSASLVNESLYDNHAYGKRGTYALRIFGNEEIPDGRSVSVSNNIVLSSHKSNGEYLIPTTVEYFENDILFAFSLVATGTTNNTIRLLNHKAASNYKNYSSMGGFIGRLYGVEFLRSKGYARFDTDDMVHMFRAIPCIDVNGRPCIYETVSGKTYYNSGTGEFTYGMILN